MCDEARASEGLIHELLTSVSRTEICIERWHLVDTFYSLIDIRRSLFGDALQCYAYNA
jgi:hypothetical protein